MKPLQDLTGAKFLLSSEDIPLLNYLNDQTDAFGLSAIPVPRVNKELVDDKEIFIGNGAIRIIHTPGHYTPVSVVSSSMMQYLLGIRSLQVRLGGQTFTVVLTPN